MLLYYMNFMFFCSVLLPSISATTMLANETDRLSLLAFKDQLTDPLGALSSWNQTLHFCQWRGVICSHRHHQRVTGLNLEAQGLMGSISPHITNLSFLRKINLPNNKLTGEIPQGIGRLFRLHHLNLTQNSLAGEIPTNLTHFPQLKTIDLMDNKLVGKIPGQLASLSKLLVLNLGLNNLTGTIPPSLGNLSSLTHLFLAQNKLDGPIPSELGRLFSLQYLRISLNNFSGTFPSSVYNLSSIYFFSVAYNKLHGIIPPELGVTLPNLQALLVGSNWFSGPIPISISNATGIEHLDFSSNNFTGSVPVNLGMLRGLRLLNLGSNMLGSMHDDLAFLTSLENCSNLQVIAVDANRLGGLLPNTIANLSTQLNKLFLGENQFFGSIPVGIENLVGLNVLDMNSNLLTGTIPIGIGKLTDLEGLILYGNSFSGSLPSSVGNLTVLSKLILSANNLEGSLPPGLGNYKFLQEMDLSKNKFEGIIPREVFSITSLTKYIILSYNSFAGSLPSEVGKLRGLGKLDISENKLSGQIPRALGDCLGLEFLYMNGNSFQGAIPQSLGNLKGIQELDLSHNNLSGRIPEYMLNFSFLRYLNLSFNNLEGEVPSAGIFRNATVISVIGNNKLCGGISKFNLITCSNGVSTRHEKYHIRRLVITLVTISSCLIVFSCFIVAFKWFRKSSHKPFSMLPLQEDMYLKVSYAELLKATSGFSSNNLIGEGSFGSVYEGILEHNQIRVAVKVLNLQQPGASKSFVAECEALKNIRHRNLIRIITSCSSIDFRGNDFKALVFEFMPKGNLDKWLHPSGEEEHQLQNLTFIQRLNIAIDVASALDYLHHRCQTPTFHCDLKPNNILLDNDMNAYIGDFGLAKIVLEVAGNSLQNQTSSNRLKGSIGYVAPEYGMGGKASAKGDVYSYGILLLEMFIGKRPTDDMFNEALSL